ncbi:U-box domain-containing protein 25-like [Chenopodium quinoa]|uniref:U-box domain-containing protein n=1 Tax=Chenopodium quinoa TaxID=63459 RepID=A0A803KX11_CHEQI|nr:U-box domain-containing protein 25-like [Chenopodium quinoa]
MSIPEFFTCPISLELFNDPVTLCTGQTYDRPSIEKWLAAGNLTCPVTMQKLQDLSMVPNHTLKHLIQQWHLKGSHNYHQFNDDYYYDDFYKVGNSKNVSFSSLKHTLEFQDSSLEKKIQVLEQIRLLSEDLPRKNGGLIQMGFFSLILGMIFGAKITQEMVGLVEKSLICAIKLMQSSNLGDLNMLLEDSKFENFKVLLLEGSCMIKTTLCNIIEKVFVQSSLATKELATKIGNDTKVLKTMVGYVDDHKQNSKLAEASIKAILSIVSSSSQEPYRENLVKEGVVHTLITYIFEVESGKDHKDLAPKATKALELVLDLESGKQAFLVKEVLNNGIKALIKMVFRVSGDDLGSESAVNCLMKLCYESMEVSEKAICGGILTQLLLLLQSQCSGRAKGRARMLLKLLRSMWAKDPIHV